MTPTRGAPTVLITGPGGEDGFSKDWATYGQYYSSKHHLSIPPSAGGSFSTSTGGSDQGEGEGEGEFSCPHCAKTKKRECDLR